MTKQGTGVLPSQMRYAGPDQQMASTAETVLEEFAPTNVSTHEPVSNKQIRFTIGSPNFHQLTESVWEFDITNKSDVPVRLDGGGCGLIQTLYIYSDQGVELERLEGAGMIATIEKQYTLAEHDLRELEAKEMFCGSLLEKSARSSHYVSDQRFSPENYPLLGSQKKRTLQVHLPGGWFNPIMGRMLPPESTFQVHIDLAPANECLVYRDTLEVPRKSEYGLGLVPASAGDPPQLGFVVPANSGFAAGDLVKFDFNGKPIVLRKENFAEIANPETQTFRVKEVVRPTKFAVTSAAATAINQNNIIFLGNQTGIFRINDVLRAGTVQIMLTNAGTVNGDGNTLFTFACTASENGQLATAIAGDTAFRSTTGFSSGQSMLTFHDGDHELDEKLRVYVKDYGQSTGGSVTLIKIRSGAAANSLNYEITNSKMIIPGTRLMDPGLMQRLDSRVETLNWMGESYRRHVLSLEPATGEQTYLIPIQARVLKGFSVVFQHTTERTKSYYYTNSQRTLNYIDQYQFTIGGIQHPRQPVVYKAGKQPGVNQGAGRHQDILGDTAISDMVLSEAWAQASGLWGNKGLVTLRDFAGSEDQLGTGVLAINLQTFGHSMSERITSGIDLSMTPLPVNLTIRKVKCPLTGIDVGAESIFGAASQTGTTIIFSHVLMAFKKDPVRGLTSRF